MTDSKTKTQVEFHIINLKFEIIDEYNKMVQDRYNKSGYFGEKQPFLYNVDEIKESGIFGLNDPCTEDLSNCLIRSKLLKLDELKKLI